MIRKPHKTKHIKKYVFNFNISEIKKQNLSFAVSYSENGSSETYTDILHYSEIEKPKGNTIKVQKIVVIKNDKIKKELMKLEAKKLISLLTFHNNNKSSL